MDIKAILEQLDVKIALGIGLAIAGLYYIMAFDDGARINAEIQSQNQKMTASRANLNKVKQAIADQNRYNQEIKEIAQNMKDFLKYFTPKMTHNDLLTEVTRRAELYGVKVNDMKPVERTPEFQGYSETAVEFELEGKFHKVMELVASMTQMKRAIDFSNVEFSTQPEIGSRSLKFKTVLVVYNAEDVDVGS